MQDLASKIKNKIENLLLITGKKNHVGNDFHALTMETFYYQYKNNPIYRQWVDLIGDDISNIDTIDKIPFLPIQFFKTKNIKTNQWESELIFRSSGTTGTARSKHHLRSKLWYQKVSKSSFESYFGALDKFTIIAILPSYLENGDSSLIYMINHFIDASSQKQSGFYLNNISDINNIVSNCSDKNILLWGVTYALMAIEKLTCDTSRLTVIETGGMKGRQQELVRAEVHDYLCQQMNIPTIGSEYGMTELLSQAYSKQDGIFTCAPTMKVLVRDPHDPLSTNDTGKGVLNIIDLANIDTCSFIATDDLGHVHNDGQFEVIGRLDNSDIRGCNLLI